MRQSRPFSVCTRAQGFTVLPPGAVKIYGACGENTGCGSSKQENPECIAQLIGQFRFYAAFENSRCQGYITEKFIFGYEHGLVPLAMGGVGRADYEKLAPGNSFLHVDDFKSIRDMADVLKRYSLDDAAYNAFFQWKRHYRLMKKREIYTILYCSLCEELWKPPSDQKRIRQFQNLQHWWYDNTCQRQGLSWWSGLHRMVFRGRGA